MKPLFVAGLFISQMALAAAVGPTANPTSLAQNSTTTQQSGVTNPSLASTQLLRGSQLNSRIEQSLQQLDYNPSQVHVISQPDGTVTLQGTVGTQSEADALLQQARTTNGGKDVEDNLQVENISQ